MFCILIAMITSVYVTTHFIHDSLPTGIFSFAHFLTLTALSIRMLTIGNTGLVIGISLAVIAVGLWYILPVTRRIVDNRRGTKPRP